MPFELFKTIPTDNVELLVPYGSTVYSTMTDTSDRDYIGVSDSYTKNEYNSLGGDITWYSHAMFQQLLDDHEISAIEAYFTNPLLGSNAGFIFNLDKVKLRNAISKKASNSWVKAKKKITLPNELSYIGIKSLFHSFRIYDFGYELATTGTLKNFKQSNYIWKEILDCKNDWDDWDLLFKKFKNRHNKLASKFREVCPKEVV